MNTTDQNPWVHPAGTASSGPWDVSLGAYDSTAVIPGWKHTGLKTATLTGQPLLLDAVDEERIIIPLAGDVIAVVDGQTYELSGRDSVFSGPADVLYTGVRRQVQLEGQPGTRLAVASAPAAQEYPTRLITKDEAPLELRGAGNCSREVRNFGTPATLEADRFIVCEVLTPAGNWSSYPPHKHDEEKDGETALEEIYYFETRVTPGAPSEAEDAIGYQRDRKSVV